MWILLFLALVILASSWLVHDTNITMLETLSQLEWQASEGDFAGAQKTIGRLNQYYKSREHFMALFIKRDYLGSTAVCLGFQPMPPKKTCRICEARSAKPRHRSK